MNDDKHDRSRAGTMDCFKGKVALITGAGGYIGALLGLKLLECDVKRLIGIDLTFANSLCAQLQGTVLPCRAALGI